MDFKTLDLTPSAEKGSAMVVRHPVTDEDLTDAKGKPVTITLLGNHSREFRQKVDEMSRRQNKRRNSDNLTLAEAERRAAELLAAVTVSWSGVEWEGQKLECNRENAEMLYRELPWVRTQVDEFVGDVGNFFKTPSTT